MSTPERPKRSFTPTTNALENRVTPSTFGGAHAPVVAPIVTASVPAAPVSNPNLPDPTAFLTGKAWGFNGGTTPNLSTLFNIPTGGADPTGFLTGAAWGLKGDSTPPVNLPTNLGGGAFGGGAPFSLSGLLGGGLGGGLGGSGGYFGTSATGTNTFGLGVGTSNSSAFFTSSSAFLSGSSGVFGGYTPSNGPGGLTWLTGGMGAGTSGGTFTNTSSIGPGVGAFVQAHTGIPGGGAFGGGASFAGGSFF